MFHSVRARLTLWYCGVLAVILMAFSGISYALIARQVTESTDEALSDTSLEFAAAFRDEVSEGNSRDVFLDFHYADREILVLSPAGEVLARSRMRTLPAETLSMLASLARRRGFFTIPGGEDDDGLRALSTPLTIQGKPYSVIVVRSLHEQTDRLENAFRALFLGIPVALLVASVGGYVLARKSLAPVLEMSRKAEQIGADTLSERIVVRNEKDELGILAHTLNGLLSRLQEAFDSQRRFMADASHELRTPLSIMQGEADVTLSRPHRTEEEYRSSLDITQRASQRLTRIVQNLFLLARSDAGCYPMNRSRFYLDEVVDSCLTSLRTIASSRNIEITFNQRIEVVMSGDEDLIHRMVLNLVENALKFSAAGGLVSVGLETDGSTNTLSISDRGRGISAEEQDRIFDRFYRVDRARGTPWAGGYGGAGLGLPIARWIAEMHSGTVRLAHSGAEGSTFVVALPVSPWPEGTV